MSLTLTSSAFENGDPVPEKYTCVGEDLSPPLSWDQVPDETRSLVLIVDDPDAPDPKAPKTVFVHWLLYNLPADSNGLSENAATEGLPQGTREGLNDWERTGYGGPCPPIGEHRYYFKLYALDRELVDLEKPNKAQLLAAMQDHIIDQTELIGTFQK